MKKVFTISSLLLATLFIMSFANEPSTTTKAVKWYSWEEAVEANNKIPKKFYVDVYTDWCGWCKVMDKKTFTDPKIAAYLNENFYPIKLNAEQKEDIVFQGNTFSWTAAGKKGIHTLAYSLLEGKMSYPSFVFLNENFERIMISPGYKKPKDLITELEFAAEEHYKTTEWKAYQIKAAGQ